MNIYDQLQAVEDRYEELGELLSDPEVVSDTKRFMELSREEANTRETVIAYREYKQVIQNISDAEEMIKEATKYGICKVNIDTDLRLALTAEVRKFLSENPAEFDPRKYLGPGRDAIKAMVQHKIKDVLNSSGSL